MFGNLKESKKNGSTPKPQKADFPERHLLDRKRMTERSVFSVRKELGIVTIYICQHFVAGNSIRSAVEMTGNVKLLTKLSTAISKDDAHAF